MAVALALQVAAGSIPFVYLTFPLWILLVSLDVMIGGMRDGREPPPAAPVLAPGD